MERVSGLVYKSENGETKVGILVSEEKPMYQNIKEQNILTYAEMIQEGAEMYDLGDDTNAMPYEEYYQRIHTVVMEDGHSIGHVLEGAIVNRVQVKVEMTEHIIYDNYNLCNDERLEEARASILDADEEGKYTTVEDIPEDVVMAEVYYNDDCVWDCEKERLDEFFDDKIWLVKGSVGRWDGKVEGGKICYSFDDIAGAWSDCDYRKLYDVNGHFMIQASHHDGTNYFEVKQVTDRGEAYIAMCDFEDKGTMLNTLWNDGRYTELPFFAEKIYGVPALEYKAFSLADVEIVQLPFFDHETLSNNLTDLSIFLANQSYRFDMNVQEVADNAVDLIQPLAYTVSSYSVADLKKAVVYMEMLTHILDNHGLLKDADGAFNWLKPATADLSKCVAMVSVEVKSVAVGQAVEAEKSAIQVSKQKEKGNGNPSKDTKTKTDKEKDDNSR